MIIKKMLCRLKGHSFNDEYAITCCEPIKDRYVTLNRCIRCGKVFTVKIESYDSIFSKILEESERGGEE